MIVNLLSAREEMLKNNYNKFVPTLKSARELALIVLCTELFNLPRPPSINVDNERKKGDEIGKLQSLVSSVKILKNLHFCSCRPPEDFGAMLELKTHVPAVYKTTVNQNKIFFTDIFISRVLKGIT